MVQKSKLLFITQKIHEHDDDLAFVTQWIDEFVSQNFAVEVLCLEKGIFDDRFPVFSLGKEKGHGRLRRIVRFYKFIFTNRYERVFLHMNPEYITLGGWLWYLQNVPTYLWYTHYTTHIHLKLAALYCTYMFAATKQSLPQYDGNPKKIVTGHGVDLTYWHAKNICQNEKELVMVHRLSRSKRVELGIQALDLLPSDYTLTIYGRPIDQEYFQELKQLVANKDLTNRVTFKGPVPMPELRKLYPDHKIMINMASATIDKTMLEAMCNGIFPVTTSANLEAIGLPDRLGSDTPENIASMVLDKVKNPIPQSELVQIVEDSHGLKSLVQKMAVYINDDV